MTDSQFLAGRVVLVTGAGRGIGRAIAELAAQCGASVVVNDRGVSTSGEDENSSPADQVVAEIQSAGGAAVASHDSVTSPEGAAAMVEQALTAFGRIDAVVNNAGILRDAFFHKMAAPDWQAVVDVHLNGSFHVSRAAAEHFRRQEGGAFVHMTSTAGLIGNIGQANYAAAKMGIVGLSRSIALDMARFKVRSNCVAPFAWSRMTGSLPITDEKQAARVERFRQMLPEKVASLVVFLCSEAALDVTGQVFVSRNNEIFLMSQPRPLRSVHRGEGWTPETIASHAMPALRSSFYGDDTSPSVFSWDPI